MCGAPMSKNYFISHLHTDASLLDAISTPEQVRGKIDELNMDGCCITDHGNIGNSIKFLKAMKGKKAIIGIEFYVCEQDATIKNESNRHLSHLLIYARNNDGWNQLVKLISLSNEERHFYYKPRLSLEQIRPFCNGNLLAVCGHLGSTISDAIEKGESGTLIVEQLCDIFGKENFFLEVQLIYKEIVPQIIELTNKVRELGKLFNIPVLATPDSHYVNRADATDQRVVLCRNLGNITLKQANEREVLKCFFESDCFFMPSYEEMIEVGHTEEELENTNLFASKFEEYTNILKSPMPPKYACPNGLTDVEYLKQLCNEGWERKIKGKVNDEKVYKDRLDMELEVLLGAELSSYFLIVADILNFVRGNGWLPGPGRGSAAGCIVSYLMGITAIDPIKYDLLFERFYSTGRNSPGHISMPDIDIDVPAFKRDQVIEYIRNKYGQDHVSQIITYQTMKGRTALKDVLRAYDNISFAEMNLITENLPEESKIIGELQEMKEKDGESSIIKYTLEQDQKAGKLREWCYIDDNGELQGPLSKRFEQAIRLEGTKTSQAKHAAGIVIGNQPLSEICPMVYDSKNKCLIAGLEMQDIESIGLVKMDILGLVLLDKISLISDILRGKNAS
jgi:DNA polymerase-3 subunit alpha